MIETAHGIKPDVISLDGMMPRVDGWEVLKRLKGDPELSKIAVIMLTITDDKNLGYSLGTTEYLIKPFNREYLLSILGRYQS